MDERLLAAYRDTDYRVRLPTGGTATLRIDEPLPAALHALVMDRPWGFVTAWNPASMPTPRSVNRRAQRRLLAELRTTADTQDIHPAIGVGRQGWREPSLFAVGVTPEALGELCRRHGQLACLVGRGPGEVRLRWIDPSPGHR